MRVTAKLKYLRIAPRKVRLVADLIRGKSLEEAQAVLGFTVKKAAKPLFKLLKQAAANAQNNLQLDPTNLYISKIIVDEGPKYKRWMPRARGQASEIQKKTSHITIVLDFTKKPKRIKKVVKKRTEEVKEEKIGKQAKKAEKVPSEGKPPAGQQPFKPKTEKVKPKRERGIKRVFRRKAF